ncbi:hypothetical protein NQ318_003531, partial [Aromia moschata]
MAHLTVTRIEILIFIKIRTQQEVCNLFNSKYPDNPITQSTVSKIESKFRETGDVKDLAKLGRPKITQDKNIDIVLSMEENPQISQTTVLRILRKENYHPYKLQLVQELNEDDPDRRLHVLSKRYNGRYWSRTNPHWIIESHTQHPQKLNVWAGIVANRIIQPLFLEETLTGERYLEFLQNDLLPSLSGMILYSLVDEQAKPGIGQNVPEKPIGQD